MGDSSKYQVSSELVKWFPRCGVNICPFCLLWSLLDKRTCTIIQAVSDRHRQCDTITMRSDHEQCPLFVVCLFVVCPRQDFGDYADSYYAVQTTEGEQIAQLISGYIDIILKKVCHLNIVALSNCSCQSMTCAVCTCIMLWLVIQ